MNVGGGEVTEGLDAVDGVAHGYGYAGGLEHGGVVVGVADGDGVGNGVAQQRALKRVAIILPVQGRYRPEETQNTR